MPLDIARMRVRLEEIATDVVRRYGDRQRHTVAAASCDAAGRVSTGLSIYHFTGGICAEMVALANLVAGGSAPVLLVAVGDGDRGVLAPCGRCRQVLLDLTPDVAVALRDEVVGIRDLLPRAYVPRVRELSRGLPLPTADGGAEPVS
jgi:cytidine deaminase